MKYVLFKRAYGSSQANHLFDFELEDLIRDFCFAEQFYFLAGHAVGKINDKQELVYPWVGENDIAGDEEGDKLYARLNTPSSIIYSSKHLASFIVAQNGRRIYKLSLPDGYLLRQLTGDNCIKAIDHFFSKTSETTQGVTDIALSDKGIYWTSGILNRCFFLGSDGVSNYVGDGYSDYTLSNNAVHTRLKNPSGVFYFNDILYLCDDNCCIRTISKNGSSLFAGQPSVRQITDGPFGTNRIHSPSKIKGCKSTFYFIDNGKVRMFTPSNANIVTLTRFKNVVAIEVDDNRNLYVLEKR